MSEMFFNCEELITLGLLLYRRDARIIENGFDTCVK